MAGEWVGIVAGAIATVVGSVGAVLVARGQARRSELDAAKTSLETAKQQRDALAHRLDVAKDYFYDLRDRMHGAGMTPPPVPDELRPPP